LYVLDRFDVLMLKIIFFLKKKNHWLVFQHEKLFEKQPQPHCQILFIKPLNYIILNAFPPSRKKLNINMSAQANEIFDLRDNGNSYKTRASTFN